MTHGQVDDLNGFIRLILRTDILEYSNFTHCSYTDTSMCIHSVEKNEIPEEYKLEVHKSVGFRYALQLKDIPIRGKVVTLSSKRRRWLVTYIDGIKSKVSRDWSIIKQGTNTTRNFAAFLKDISR